MYIIHAGKQDKNNNISRNNLVFLFIIVTLLCKKV
nr:hypothetical protein RKQZWNHN_RKQZWNHN_CDS_0002 [Microvirus sp.]CAI9751502.1 hypothetical protein PTLEEYKN_PTLEEYKN_CDS_0002 [Microvirus sp.]